MGMELRPTTAKVRTALINIWRGELSGSAFLDLCTGTGAIALAARQAGARFVVAVDASPKVIRKLLGACQPRTFPRSAGHFAGVFSTLANQI